MKNITINIYESDNGYMYDVYIDQEIEELEDVADGGLCTGNIDQAIEMATDTAKDLVKRGV